MLLVFFLVFAWQPLRAWYADDAGNLALFKGHAGAAADWFAYGLQREPHWGLLHEDLGRALLDSDPAAALREFRIAACGAPCTAEVGDALLRLGRVDDAIRYYIASKAVARVEQRAEEFADRGSDNQAIALEEALIARLHDNFFERAELASAYAALGSLQMRAADKRTSQSAAWRYGALESLRRASTLAPYNERYLLLYGFTAMQSGNKMLARAAFEQLLRLHPHQRDAEAALSQLTARPARKLP